MKSLFYYEIIILLFSSLINAESFTLTDCIMWALENKKTVISQRINVEIARKDVDGAYSNFKPSIQLFSNKNYLNININFAPLKKIFTFLLAGQIGTGPFLREIGGNGIALTIFDFTLIAFLS